MRYMPRKKRFFGRGGIYKDGTSLPESIVCADRANLVHSQVAQISGQYPTVARQMMRQRYGRIVNLSSVVGVRGNAGQVNYAASKAGVIGMTKSLAKELASRGVTVNAIAPGFIETDMTAAMPEAAKTATLASIPMGRLGQAEDVARAIAFLAAEESGYITGQVLCVDGGMAM